MAVVLPGYLKGVAQAESAMDALLSDFCAAAASVVRVVGQYPCPLPPTLARELGERYGHGLKYLVNGMVFRRLTSGFAVAHSPAVIASVVEAPKRAAASQRAMRACRGRIPSLCVPLSVRAKLPARRLPLSMTMHAASAWVWWLAADLI